MYRVLIDQRNKIKKKILVNMQKEKLNQPAKVKKKTFLYQ
jgi:hypothetical protein